MRDAATIPFYLLEKSCIFVEEAAYTRLHGTLAAKLGNPAQLCVLSDSEGMLAPSSLLTDVKMLERFSIVQIIQFFAKVMSPIIDVCTLECQKSYLAMFGWVSGSNQLALSKVCSVALG